MGENSREEFKINRESLYISAIEKHWNRELFLVKFINRVEKSFTERIMKMYSFLYLNLL